MRLLVVIFLLLTLSGCKRSNSWVCNGDCDNGFGTKKWSDGGYEQGNWKDGELYGKGTQFFGSSSKFAGDKYIGGFNNGYNGFGIYYSKSGDGSQIGYWENGKPNGYGKSIFGQKALHPHARYEGGWKNGVYDGQGIWYGGDSGEWANESYNGYWRNGERDGFGKCYFTDSTQYVGNWKNGEMDGDGTFIFINGERYNGHWQNGEDPNFKNVLKVHNDVMADSIRNSKSAAK